MIAPVDGSGSWPACRQMVLNRASRCELHDPATITSANIAKSTYACPDHAALPRSACQAIGDGVARARARCPAARSSSAWRVKLAVSLVGLAARRRAARSSASSTRWPASRSPSARVYFLFRLFVARQAPPALARPPQADPLVHLHRLRPGDAASSRSSCCAGCCCSTTSARTWCRAGCARSSDAGARFSRRARRSRSSAPAAATSPASSRGGRRTRRASSPGVSIAVVPRRTVRAPTEPRRRDSPSDGDRRRRRPGPWAHVDPPAAMPAWIDCAGFTGVLAYFAPAARRGRRADGHAHAGARRSRFPTSPRAGLRRGRRSAGRRRDPKQQLRSETGVELKSVDAPCSATSRDAKPLAGRAGGDDGARPRRSGAAC